MTEKMVVQGWTRKAAGALNAGGGEGESEGQPDAESLKALIEQKNALDAQLASRTSSVASDVEKNSDVGLSQYGQSTTTTTLARADALKKEDVGTVFADLSNRMLPYPALVFDRCAWFCVEGLGFGRSALRVACCRLQVWGLLGFGAQGFG